MGIGGGGRVASAAVFSVAVAVAACAFAFGSCAFLDALGIRWAFRRWFLLGGSSGGHGSAADKGEEKQRAEVRKVAGNHLVILLFLRFRASAGETYEPRFSGRSDTLNIIKLLTGDSVQRLPAARFNLSTCK